jgi:hypothetical protein
MVPKLSAKSSHCEDAGAVRKQAPSNTFDAARGSGRKFLSAMPATVAEQMRFFLKIHNSKVSKIKKATSFQFAKPNLTCQAL